MSVLVSFSVPVIKYHDKINLKNKVFMLAHNSRLYSVVVGKPRQWKFEITSHITFIIKIRERESDFMWTNAQLILHL